MGDSLIRIVHYCAPRKLLVERTGAVDRVVMTNSMVKACDH